MTTLSGTTPHIELAQSLAQVDPEQWNALAGDHPAARHAYLHGLEVTGCVGPQTGWSPHHLLLYRDDTLAGAMPLYLKSHSRGEYVFDHAWAHAFQQHGLPYYPKLLCAIPFTPVPGPRLLAPDDKDKAALLQAAIALADSNRLSSLHILFPHEPDLSVLDQAGLMVRKAVQFHWHNPGYGTMDDFLRQMNQRNRKKARQSRRKLTEEGVEFVWKEGEDIDDDTLNFFYRCYQQTYLEHGNLPYLNREFFYHLRATMADALVVVVAHQHHRPVASALNLRGAKRLFGRYWGSMRFISGLHFETCYMQGIEYCIARGLDVFEGGAQGEHKLARGLMPVETHSAHWVRDHQYAQAISDFLMREGDMVESYIDELEAHSPFRHRKENPD